MKSINDLIQEASKINESGVDLFSLDSKDQDKIWKAVQGDTKKQIEDYYERIWRIALLDREVKPQVRLMEAIFGSQNLPEIHSRARK